MASERGYPVCKCISSRTERRSRFLCHTGLQRRASYMVLYIFGICSKRRTKWYMTWPTCEEKDFQSKISDKWVKEGSNWEKVCDHIHFWNQHEETNKTIHDMTHFRRNVFFGRNFGKAIALSFFRPKTLCVSDLADFCTKCSSMNYLWGNGIRTWISGMEVYQFSDRASFSLSRPHRAPVKR